jgi:hypothetical protein
MPGALLSAARDKTVLREAIPRHARGRHALIAVPAFPMAGCVVSS